MKEANNKEANNREGWFHIPYTINNACQLAILGQISMKKVMDN